MNNKIFCSSGTVVGRVNNYNYRLFTENAKDIEADGFELMMIKAYYDCLPELISEICKKGLFMPVIHAEKDIGIAFVEKNPDIREKSFELFELNCSVGKAVGAKKIVFHLWSGLISDSFYENNLDALPRLCEISEKYGLTLLIENVPTTRHDPFSNLLEIEKRYPYINFIFDTRFGAFHEQTDKFLSSKWLENGKIAHMHFSDFIGPPRDFSALRPILHLGEGIVGFDSIMPQIREKYHGSITLESPEIHENGPDIEKINRDLRYMRKNTEKI